MRRTLLATVPVVLLVLSGTASAHGAPNPRDFETRILTDQNDDCGEHGADGCRGTHDLLAVSIREAHDADLGDVLVVSLWMDHGGSGAKRDIVSFQAGGDTKTVTFRTSGDGTFTVDGAARISAPYPVPSASAQDGTRFGVDATVALSTLGIGKGDRVSGFKVDAYAGETRGDIMPGTYVTALGTEAPKGANEQGAPAEYVRAAYTLRGPVQYADLDADGPVTVPADSEAFVALRVANRLGDMAQTFTFSATGGAGVTVGFHAPGSPDGEYPPTMRLDVPPDGDRLVHLVLVGQESGAGGTVTVTLATDLGGRVQDTVAYTVGEGTTSPAASTTSQAPDGQDSPGAAAPLALLLVALTAWMRRR